MQKQNVLSRILQNEKAGGIILIIVTLLSLLLANSAAGVSYIHFWELHIGPLSVGHWINEALMSVFFLLIGLEVKQEIVSGQLSTLKLSLIHI